MFKALLSFLKSLFTTLNRASKVVDDVTSAGLFYSETFLKEAYHENDKRSRELDINEEDFQKALERIRKL